MTIFKNVIKCTMTNASAIWQRAAHTTNRLSPSCSTRAIQKSLTQWKIFESFLERKKSRESGPLAEKWQDRKSKRLKQKNKRGDRKGESNDSPEIPDVRHPLTSNQSATINVLSKTPEERPSSLPYKLKAFQRAPTVSVDSCVEIKTASSIE